MTSRTGRPALITGRSETNAFYWSRFLASGRQAEGRVKGPSQGPGSRECCLHPVEEQRGGKQIPATAGDVDHSPTLEVNRDGAEASALPCRPFIKTDHSRSGIVGQELVPYEVPQDGSSVAYKAKPAD